MSKLTTVKNFLGGADNVVQLEVLQGERRQLVGTIRDSNGNPVNITDFRFEVAQEFRTATISESRGNTVLSNVSSEVTDATELVGSPSPVTIEKRGVAENGQFTMTIPENLYPSDNDVPVDATENVPICVVYVRYRDGQSLATTETAPVSRYVIIIRHAPPIPSPS